jgi:hypothetical protein
VIRQRLAELDGLSMCQLRSLWQRQYQVQVPRTLRRDLLIRFIAYRLQEEEFGGLGKSTLRRLETIVGKLRDPNVASPADVASLKPGTTLVREWNGTTNTVLVLEDGFEHEGERYPSLTKVAAVISGLHRSGPAFFGLKGRLARFAEQGRGFGLGETKSE